MDDDDDDDDDDDHCYEHLDGVNTKYIFISTILIDNTSVSVQVSNYIARLGLVPISLTC